MDVSQKLHVHWAVCLLSTFYDSNVWLTPIPDNVPTLTGGTEQLPKCFRFFIDNTNFQSLLDLSREYQINEIKTLCEVHLLRKPPTVDQLIIAEEYDLTNLRERCLKELSEKALNGLQDHPRFNEISDKTRLVIMEQQLKRLQTYCKKISQIATATDMR